MIELGSKVRDRVSQYEGIVIGESRWLTGCLRYIVQGPVKDGKRPEADSFDEQSLEILLTPTQTGVHASGPSLEIEQHLKNLTVAAAPGGPGITPSRW